MSALPVGSSLVLGCGNDDTAASGDDAGADGASVLDAAHPSDATTGASDASDAGDAGTVPSPTTYTVSGMVTGLSGAGLVLQNNAGDNLAISASGAFSFKTKIANGAAYAVTVLTQPSAPSQVCTVTKGSGKIAGANVTDVGIACVTSSFTVGGTVTGLKGTGLVLQDNAGDDLAVSQNGAFTFAKALPSGSTYAVTVKTQPGSPAQVCSVSGGNGSVVNGNVSSVTINCSTTTYTIGGSVTGLSGSGLVLQNNAGDNLTVNANGTFAFATPIASGGAYAVTVKTQPSNPAQTCTVTAGSGTASANVSSVAVTCVTNKYKVGGTITGLAAGASVVLQDNAGDNLTVNANGTFQFGTSIASNGAYAVTVLTQPSSPVQTCTVTNGTGSVGAADVSNVAISCTTKAFSVGGTVVGLTGTGLVLQDNSGDDLSVSANGGFTFNTKVASGAAYKVTVKTQPNGPTQTCNVSAGTGTVGAGNVTSVTVNCADNSYVVGGTISGLAGGDHVILQDNSGDDLDVTSNGSFAFAVPIASGGSYAVTVKTQPGAPAQTCTVTAGTGNVTSADIASVQVACVTNTYKVGGAVSGLAAGDTLVLQDNGGDDLLISGDGTFQFATSVASGASYNATVLTQPGNPAQTCVIAAGTAGGAVGAQDVSNITITCTTNTYSIGGNVTGLASGASVTLQDNGANDLVVTGNAPFTFGSNVASGQPYNVTVSAQPGSPSQTCTVTAGAGAVAAANVTNVGVDCVTNAYKIGGTLSGLAAGATLVLQDNGGNDLSLTQNGAFSFSSSVLSGNGYTVTVKTQPSSPTQTCTITADHGTVGSGDVTSVAVNCATNQYTIGGTLTGLAAGDSVVLQNNAGNDLTLAQNGSFSFGSTVASGGTYAVTVKTSPTSPISQACTVTANGSGGVSNANVTNVAVNCATKAFKVGGTITGLNATSITLLDNGADSLTKNADGTFQFATAVASGSPYSVTIASTTESCTASASTGTIANADVANVNITCTPFTSCKTMHTALPSLASGAYLIDVDGNGSIAPFNATCDMTYADAASTNVSGGWTLIFSGNLGPDNMAGGVVTSGSNKYMPIATMEALANISSQVHMRTAGNTSRAIVSTPGSSPILRLRAGNRLNDPVDPNGYQAPWTGPFASPTYLFFNCGSGNEYPNLYWACNGTGMHVLQGHSRWLWSNGDTTQNEVMEAWVR